MKIARAPIILTRAPAVVTRAAGPATRATGPLAGAAPAVARVGIVRARGGSAEAGGGGDRAAAAVAGAAAPASRPAARSIAGPRSVRHGLEECLEEGLEGPPRVGLRGVHVRRRHLAPGRSRFREEESSRKQESFRKEKRSPVDVRRGLLWRVIRGKGGVLRLSGPGRAGACSGPVRIVAEGAAQPCCSMTWTRSMAGSGSVCVEPLGQWTTISSTDSSSPRPKVTGSSTCER